MCSNFMKYLKWIRIHLFIQCKKIHVHPAFHCENPKFDRQLVCLCLILQLHKHDGKFLLLWNKDISEFT